MPTWAIFLYCTAMISSIISWFRIPDRSSVWLKIAGAQVVLGFAVEITGWIIYKGFDSDQMPIVNLYFLVESFLIGAVVIRTNVLLKRITIILVSISVCVFTYYAIKNGINRFTLLESEVVRGLVFSILAFSVLWRMAESSKVRLTELKEFWYFLGLLVFFGGFIPIMGTIMMIWIKNPELAGSMYVILGLLITIRYAMNTYAFHLERKRQHSMLSANGY